MKKLTFSILLMLTSSIAFAGQVAENAKKLEAEMDKTKADFSNPAITDLSIKATIFVHKSLSAGKLDDADYSAVARIIVRAYDYDQEGDMADCNAGLVAKHRKGLKKAVTKIVGEPGISSEGLQMGRTFIEGGEEPEAGYVCGIIRALKAEVKKPSPTKKAIATPAKKTGGLFAFFKKKTVENQEGAGFPGIVFGPGAHANKAASAKLFKNVMPSHATAGESTFSSFDPTIAAK